MRWYIALLWFLLRLTGRLPLRALHALGAGLGLLLWWLPTKLAHHTRVNLDLVLPQYGKEQRRRLGRHTLQETGKSITEIARIWGRGPERALPLVREVEGQELFDAARHAGRGLIVAAPHLGCWELLNFWLCQHTLPADAAEATGESGMDPATGASCTRDTRPSLATGRSSASCTRDTRPSLAIGRSSASCTRDTRPSLAIVYRPPRRAAIEPLLVAARGALRPEQVRAEGAGIRTLYRRLQSGGVVGILPDQLPKQGEGEFAPFFGVPALSMVLVSRLAQRSGCAVLFAFAERLPRGAGYRIHFRPAPDGIADSELPRAVAALNQGVEDCVRQAFTQYQWHYKRYQYHPDPAAPNPYWRGR